MTKEYSSALSGLTVLDFTSMMAGPLCGRYLADLGARVIKIEPPDGDYMRSRPPLRDGRSAYFAQLNAGKESLRIDLKAPEGVARVLDLASDADIVLESFRPGTMDRLGLGYENIKARNPSMIYCSISGFGQNGPFAQRPAYAQAIHALSGFDMAHMSYQRDQSSPSNSVLFVADTLGASFALSSILTALRQRDADRMGHHIDLSLLDTMYNLMVYEVQEAQFPQLNQRPSYAPMKTADGFVLVAPTTPKNFLSLCRVISRPDLPHDPRFETVDARYAHWDELMEIVQAWAEQRTTQACEDALIEAGVPCGRYNTVKEALDDRSLGARSRFGVTADDSGTVAVPRLPFLIDGCPVRIGQKVP
ncbi:CaiB/BaiF CoA-transferase family protein [Oceanicola sp. 502str15]|uniref:CaiB/BaiF CoA transferase family protein n=1 Tax=Oceanicola sp. 502str15 TaxID=2696061 RepID=UPI002095006B|nr:CoA transferase [Oceanicola sp. 502str15]MCO6385308.1 CoA transferase [Oceanicola sp. 502str15]